ncbi:MAG: acetoacetate decarboxylase family protein, partial [Candidatus Lokiarchaeota archaeon]|nr:acetoacetate decarboxylase family protein [Candidatus Lokiarchaeota archaeon]
AMPVTDDNALITGVLMGGYPKKMATIEFQAEGSAIAGHVERYGIRFFSMVLDVAAPPDDPGCEALATSYISPKGVFVFNLMNIPAPSADAVATKAYLYKQRIKTRPTRTQFCKASIELHASKFDPWAELSPVKVLGGWMFEGELVMQDVILVEEQPMTDYVFLSFKGMDFVRFP